MIQTEDVATAIYGPHGPIIESAIQMLNMVPIEELRKAFNNISRLESAGCMIDPTAWLDGKRFKNAAHYKDLIEILISLRTKCEQIKAEDAPR